MSLELGLLVFFFVEFLYVGDGLRWRSFTELFLSSDRIRFELRSFGGSHVARQLDELAVAIAKIILSEKSYWLHLQTHCGRSGGDRLRHRRARECGRRRLWWRSRGFGCAD